MNSEIKDKLTQLAFKRSTPFCYNCYQECLSGCCRLCGTDDLMRLVHGIGVEYGTDWVIQHILETELTSVNLEESFEEFIRRCYPETTKVGWMEFDTVTLMKENDPVGWRCALAEYESNEEAGGLIVSFNGGETYYLAEEIEELCND